MTNEGVKAFFPKREQRAAPMISAVRFPNKPVAAWRKSHSPGCAIKRRQ